MIAPVLAEGQHQRVTSARMNRAFGQERRARRPFWRLAPGYGDRRVLAKRNQRLSAIQRATVEALVVEEINRATRHPSSDRSLPKGILPTVAPRVRESILAPTGHRRSRAARWYRSEPESTASSRPNMKAAVVSRPRQSLIRAGSTARTLRLDNALPLARPAAATKQGPRNSGEDHESHE